MLQTIRENGLRLQAQALAQHHPVRQHGQAGGPQQTLHEGFVHPHGRSRDACPHVGQAGHLQQALNRAVLPVGAVEDREDHVQAHELGSRPISTFAAGDQGPLTRAGAQRQGTAQTLGTTRLQGGPRGTGREPAALAGDGQGDHLITPGVQTGQDGPGRKHADLVFGGAATEEEAEANLAAHGPSIRNRCAGACPFAHTGAGPVPAKPGADSVPLEA